MGALGKVPGEMVLLWARAPPKSSCQGAQTPGTPWFLCGAQGSRWGARWWGGAPTGRGGQHGAVRHVGGGTGRRGCCLSEVLPRVRVSRDGGCGRLARSGGATDRG